MIVQFFMETVMLHYDFIVRMLYFNLYMSQPIISPIIHFKNDVIDENGGKSYRSYLNKFVVDLL